MITLTDLITSSGKYKNRANSPELTEEKKANGAKLLDKINALMTDLKVTQPLIVSSGYRTSESNAATPNAAKKSSHMECRACDILDEHNTLGKLVTSHPEILRKHGLFAEDLSSTKNWLHLDDADRSDRPFRTFKP